MHNKSKWLKSMTMLLLAVVLVACNASGSDPEPTTAPEPTALPTAEPTEAPAMEEKEEKEEESEEAEESMEEDASMAMDSDIVADADTPLGKALAGDYDGTVVTVFSPAVDEDERKFNEAMARFEKATGIDIQYEGSKEFEAAISVRADAGSPPDIADFPQPGLLANFARDGLIVDVSEYISEDYLKGQYIDSWVDMTRYDSPDGEIVGGVFYRVFGKSQVFYPKAAWEAAGYDIPTTWDDMLKLSQQIADDGDTAWCIGIESGVATGWTATDWMEEVMLRTTSLENYDAWTTGNLAFASPEVTNAAETLAEVWFNDDFVNGGRSQIATTSFGDAPNGMFTDPPECWLHKQGSFITSFFPEGTTPDDYGIFYLPPIDEEYGRPYLVSGDIFAAFSDRPEVMAVMQYLTTGDSLKDWMAQGGALSPHKDASIDWYGDPVDQQIGAFIADATSVRFDGSDLMPGEVGAGTFWTEMTDWVSGSTDLDTALENIDASWPEGVEGETGGVMGETAGFLKRAMDGEFADTVVTVFSPAVDEDERKFNEAMARFEEATGIDIQYEGSKEFEAAISVRADAGSPPDIADFPQPGLLANFVRDGLIVDMSQYMSEEYLQGQYIDSWIDMTRNEGPDGEIISGVFYRVFGKSQVFYPKEAWDAAGYEIPETWDDLLKLTETIADDGDTAWCIGIESGVATGWTVTDWMEEVMLRTTSLDNYDDWTTGDLPFTSNEVRNAADILAEIWFNDDYVNGGRSQIATTSFGDAPNGMFTDPPECWLHKQGSFITSFFPEGTTPDDYGIFYLPPINEELGRPYLVSGDIFAAFSDRPEVIAVMEYLTTSDSLKDWMAQGGALSPHKDAQIDWYGDPVDQQIGALIAQATSVRFDGSDLMPGEVGAGTFWTEMTAWVSGTQDLDTSLESIDASWPR